MAETRDIMTTFEVAVIGAGVMGSSAAHYLAQEGRKTVLIDQFPLPHSRGSSGGHSRITRQANYGIPALTPIMSESNKEWRNIERQTGMALLRSSPLLTVGQSDCPVSYDRLRQMEDSVRKSGFKPEVLSIEEVNHRFRTNFPSNYEGMVDPSAGILMADKCLQAFQKLFIKNGGKILDGWPVTSISPGEVIEIQGRDGKKIKVKSVIICPGAWFSPLLATLGIKAPTRAEKVVVLYWKIKDSKMPTFTLLDVRDGGRYFYALPDFEYPGFVKLSFHVGFPTDPNERDKAKINASLIPTVKKYITENIPCLEPVPAVVESCMYTETPDHSFILDRHPLYRNILFAGGFSGTGFKIAPACGEALAMMAMGQEPKLDFTDFSLGRFDQEVKKSHL